MWWWKMEDTINLKWICWYEYSPTTFHSQRWRQKSKILTGNIRLGPILILPSLNSRKWFARFSSTPYTLLASIIDVITLNCLRCVFPSLYCPLHLCNYGRISIRILFFFLMTRDFIFELKRNEATAPSKLLFCLRFLAKIFWSFSKEIEKLKETTWHSDGTRNLLFLLCPIEGIDYSKVEVFAH